MKFLGFIISFIALLQAITLPILPHIPKLDFCSQFIESLLHGLQQVRLVNQIVIVLNFDLCLAFLKALVMRYQMELHLMFEQQL